MLYSLFPTKKTSKLCLPTKEVGLDLFNKMLEKFDDSTGMVKYLVELGEVWEILVGMCFGTIVISIFYIFLLRWITKPLLYISMLAILIGFILLGGWCWLKKGDYDEEL
jgi:4-hydroxybenzoate polyprenyltransferase